MRAAAPISPARPISGCRSCRPPSGVFRIAIQQLDRNALRPAQEADLDARPRRRRLLGELDALLLEVGGNGVDAGNRQAEMVEPLIGRRGRAIDAVAGGDLREEDIGAAELDVDARLAQLRGCGAPARRTCARTIARSLPDRACADGC